MPYITVERGSLSDEQKEELWAGQSRQGQRHNKPGQFYQGQWIHNYVGFGVSQTPKIIIKLWKEGIAPSF